MAHHKRYSRRVEKARELIFLPSRICTRDANLVPWIEGSGRALRLGGVKPFPDNVDTFEVEYNFETGEAKWTA